MHIRRLGEAWGSGQVDGAWAPPGGTGRHRCTWRGTTWVQAHLPWPDSDDGDGATQEGTAWGRGDARGHLTVSQGRTTYATALAQRTSHRELFHGLSLEPHDSAPTSPKAPTLTPPAFWTTGPCVGGMYIHTVPIVDRTCHAQRLPPTPAPTPTPTTSHMGKVPNDPGLGLEPSCREAACTPCRIRTSDIISRLDTTTPERTPPPPRSPSMLHMCLAPYQYYNITPAPTPSKMTS